MSRLDLPGGGWAELRDVEKIPESLRRPVKRKLVEAGAFATNGDVTLTAEAWDTYEELQDATILAMVSAWSFPDGITSETLLARDGDVYDALAEAVKDAPMAMFPKSDPEDPKAPTGP